MRTTITLADALVKQARASSGRQSLSEALTVTLNDYFRLKQRLALLDDLFDHSVPHDFKRIKAQRKGRKWSS